MEIKFFNENNIPSFINLWNQDYKALTSSGFIMTRDKALSGFKQKMFDYYGLFDKKKLIGFILYQLDGNKIWLKHLLIDKEKRKYGYGQLMLKETIKYYNGKEIYTEVLFNNSQAKSFFEKNGFKVLKKDIKGKQYILSFRLS